MKRLVRYIFNGLTVLSLLLCVATAVLWVRSYWRWDEVAVGRQFPIPKSVSNPSKADERSVTWASGSRFGRCYLLRMQNDFRYLSVIGYPRYWASIQRFGDEAGADEPYLSDNEFEFRPKTSAGHAGFSLESNRQFADHYFSIMVPHWFLAMIFGVGPVAWLAGAYTNHTRLVRNLCPFCGYDLRATPDRCPECGNVPTKVMA